MASEKGYHKEPVPKSRTLIIENCELALQKHRMIGLFEADITDARRTLHEYKDRIGESISFTGWIAACIGKALDEHKQVHAIKIGKNFLIFDDVNISLSIETMIEGKV